MCLPPHTKVHPLNPLIQAFVPCVHLHAWSSWWLWTRVHLPSRVLSFNAVLPSLGACSCNTEAPLIRIRDISYDQRNSISRTSPRRTKWSFANPPQLLIAATNITGHKWLHPQTQIWLIKHRLRLSVLFTLVYHSGINTHLWKCDPSTVMHFIMIYARTIHGKCGSTSRINPQSNSDYFTKHLSSLVFATLWDIYLSVHIHIHR